MLNFLFVCLFYKGLSENPANSNVVFLKVDVDDAQVSLLLSLVRTVPCCIFKVPVGHLVE